MFKLNYIYAWDTERCRQRAYSPDYTCLIGNGMCNIQIYDLILLDEILSSKKYFDILFSEYTLYAQ